MSGATLARSAADPLAVAVGVGPRRVALGLGGLELGAQLVALGREHAERAPRVLELLHHLELGVLEVALPARERPDLVLQVLQVLRRRRPGPRASSSWSRGGAHAHLLDVGLGLGLRALEVVDLGLGGDDRGRAARRGGPRARRSVASCGQAAAPVLDLVEAGVERLQVEQAELDGGLGVHRSPRCSRVVVRSCGARAYRRAVHGSVTIVDTWVSTVTPSAARSDTSRSRSTSQPGPLRRPVRHVDAAPARPRRGGRARRGA